MSTGTVSSISRVSLISQTRQTSRLCVVRIKGTGKYIGNNGELTTWDKAKRMTFDRAAIDYPEKVYHGMPVEFKVCQVITHDTDW